MKEVVVKLPCEIGTIIYNVIPSLFIVNPYRVDSFKIVDDGIYAMLSSESGAGWYTCNIKQFGKTIFFTKEEAEEKLKGE